MDKFTVDIDQVLNDFEYSELTDQYSNDAEAERKRISSCSYGQNHQNVTKHSINNVFHSLNEYLNTSISEKPSAAPENSTSDFPKVDNKLVDNNDVDVAGTFQKPARELDSSEKTDIGLSECDKIDNILFKDEELLNCSQDSQIGDTVVDKFEDFVDDNKIVSDLSKSLDATGDNLESFKTNIESKINDLVVEIKDKEEGFELNVDKGDNEKFQTDINKCEERENNNVILNNLVEHDADNLKLEDSESCTEVIYNNVCVKEENNTKPSFNCDIGAIVDLNDCDIEKNDENKQKEELKDDNGEYVSSVIDDSIIENNIIEVNSQEMVATDETKSENTVVENVIEQIEDGDIKNNEIIEKSKVVEQNERKPISFEDDLNLDDSELNKLLEELELDQELKETEDDQKVEKQESTNEPLVATEVLASKTEEDPLPRPQNLPLKEATEENRRTIDLVGGPGSTPYNNVYVNKEIPKTQQDSDTEYSTSASPTFSDISTESTSTASTVSVDGAERRKAEENEKGESRKSGASTEEACPEAELEECMIVTADEGNISENIIIAPEGAAALDDIEESENPSGVADDCSDDGKGWIGKQAPLWVPDSEATACLHCDMKFTVLKRRHHCRGCGLVLCSKCCYLRFKLEYLDAEARVCNKCYNILNRGDGQSSSASDASPEAGNSPFRPNPSNPLEYCSTVPPPQQAALAGASANPPAVMVPVGVLKRKGSNKTKHNKSVMFCDGIKPGSDLTNLDNDFNYTKKSEKKSEQHKDKQPAAAAAVPKVNKNLPKIDPDTKCFIPAGEDNLPPTVTVNKTDVTYTECSNSPSVVEMLRNEALTFAIETNLVVHLKIINMSCCINKVAWCFSTEGLMNVGNDELVFLIEYIDEESFVPKDVFLHIHNIYLDAVKGTTIKEMGLSLHPTSNFLGSKNHAGFVYIRSTFQCVENVIQPNEPYLVGILIHRWETPWAKLFPLRLVLRLGAEYRYYPSPLISTRYRESMFVEIGHTIINLLADFRNFTYTIPQVRGLTIHMEDKNTTITIPVNRYEAVIKTINNSSDHILAFAGNFSLVADSHLVCIQDTQDSTASNNNYSTHAINIHNRPRQVTGASFVVFNGALKSSSGLSAKSNIVEDGLMIQVLPDEMRRLRDALRAMKGYTISCGCVGGPGDEVVNIVWGENDTNFNLGIKSPIDKMVMSGIPSIRVHNGKDYVCHSGSRLIRWTEVFILKNGEENPKNQDPVDISKVSESIAKATCNALVKYLDLLATNSFYKLGIRTTLHVENVSYSAGGNGVKLPPIYMKSLDNELIPVLHRITSNNLGENHIELELIFRILNV